MKTVKTNSEDWLELRKNKIGASDANIILGVSEFMTPLDLYLKKKGLPARRKYDDNEFITSKGHWLEDKIRAEVELETGCNFPPEIRIHSQIGYLMASMDGLNEQWQMAIEIKYVGQDKFLEVQNWSHESGEPFPLTQYYPQIQHQYLCSGVNKIAVVVTTEIVEMQNGKPYKPEGKFVYLLNKHGKKQYKKLLKYVPINTDYIMETLLPAVTKFQKQYIDKNVEPPPMEIDIIEVKDSDAKKRINDYRRNQQKIILLKNKIKPLEDVEKTLKKEIFKLSAIDAPKMIYRDVLLSKVKKTGSIDYESALKSTKDNLETLCMNLRKYETMDDLEAEIRRVINLNLDNFRKANSFIYKITLTKPKKNEKEKAIESIKAKAVAVEIPPKPKPEPEPEKDLSKEQKMIIAINNFKTSNGKMPTNWHKKNLKEKGEYFRRTSKRSDVTPKKKKEASIMAEYVKNIIENS